MEPLMSWKRRVRNYRNPNDLEKEHNDSHFCHTSQTHNPLAKRGNCHWQKITYLPLIISRKQDMSQQPICNQPSQQPQTNQANIHGPTQLMTTTQQAPTGQSNKQPTRNIQPSQESIRQGISNQPIQHSQTNQANKHRPTQPMIINQQPPTPTSQSSKQPNK